MIAMTCQRIAKTRKYREEVERAFKLKEEGLTHIDIAKEMGRDVERIKGWILGADKVKKS